MDRFGDSPQNQTFSLGSVPPDSETPNSRVPLSRKAIVSHLGNGNIGANPIILEEIDSTNDYLKRLPLEQSPHGTVAVAEYQTRGKGRHGRTWQARPRENLLFSLVLEGPAILGGLVTLLGACGALEAVRQISPLPALKWPNDLVAGGKKLGGVLCEAAATAGARRRYILGIGINVNPNSSEIPEDLRESATSMRILTGCEWDRNRLLGEILHRIDSRWENLLGHGPEALVAFARTHCETLGRRVRMKTGSVPVEGMALDLDLNGALVLLLQSGLLRSFEIGEIEESR